MKIFDGILICTDLDGTLFKNDKTVSKENLKAIEYFIERGGIFTFVTGRMPYYVGDILNKVKPNAPIGCINGGGLYDYINQKYLWKSAMPDETVELIKFIDDKFENIGIHVVTFEKTYFSKENSATEHFRKITNQKRLICHYTEVREPLAKIIFSSDDVEEILSIENTLHNHPLAEKFDFIRSEKAFYEVLPKGINKGASIQKLCEYLNIDINKTIAIGDYNNDIPMFKAAKAGIAVSNACDDALKAADYITVSNEENAIAQVISDLEKGKYI